MKNVLNTYFSTVFKKAVKNGLDRQTLCFTVANFVHYEKQYTFSKNSNETRRICGQLAAPDFANSGKNMCIFLVVVVAVVVVVVVAEDIVEDDAEDDIRERCRRHVRE